MTPGIVVVLGGRGISVAALEDESLAARVVLETNNHGLQVVDLRVEAGVVQEANKGPSADHNLSGDLLVSWGADDSDCSSR